MTELTVLAAFAHPDDETILAGGMLAMLIDQGAIVHLLLATRGEGGELGEPPLVEQAGLGSLREQELHCAAKVLGIKSVLFLDYEDPLVGTDELLHPFKADLEALAQEISAVLRATGSQALITHGSNGEYGHPAHILMHRACKLALQSENGFSTPLYTISAEFPDHPRPRLANQQDLAHFVIDVQPWLTSKRKAAECHQSQGALFLRRSSQEAGRQLKLAEVLMKVESLHRAWPPPGTPVPDPFERFLRRHCHPAILIDNLGRE